MISSVSMGPVTLYGTLPHNVDTEIESLSSRQRKVDGQKKLLVVDDEFHIRLFFFEELEEEGYEVVTSDGSQDILELVDREKPHAIILDIKLEGGHSGFDLLRAVRSKYQNLPVILCTALHNLQSHLQTIEADCFVSKSIDSTELKLSIKNVLNIS